MKKSLVVILAVSIVLFSCVESSDTGRPATGGSSSPVQAQSVVKEEPFLFRELPWGSSREEVIAKEGNTFKTIPSNESEMLLYQNVKVGGESADMGIIIAPEYGLTGALYSFRINTEGFPYNTKPFIDAYSRLYGLLSEIYGSAESGSHAARSKGDDLQDYMEYFFKGGQQATWKQKGTTIYLSLSPKEPEEFDLADWTLSISYASPHMQESSRAKRKGGL